MVSLFFDFRHFCRSKRRRQQINYKFNDYDELLDDAIEEGTEWVWEDEDGNPIERPREMGNYRRDQGSLFWVF